MATWPRSASLRRPLWRSLTKDRGLGDGRMHRTDVFRMVKRRSRAAELGGQVNCHTFRATGITAYLLNGGSIEGAQAIAARVKARARPSSTTVRPTASRWRRSRG